jgi:Cytochrome B6-F complex subunit VI (PetL)
MTTAAIGYVGFILGFTVVALGIFLSFRAFKLI